MTEDDLEKRLYEIIGPYKCTVQNPAGVYFYFDEGEEKPYRIADDWASENFATYEELLVAAHKWRASFDDDNAHIKY